jgi:hypothetical protein
VGLGGSVVIVAGSHLIFPAEFVTFVGSVVLCSAVFLQYGETYFVTMPDAAQPQAAALPGVRTQSNQSALVFCTSNRRDDHPVSQKDLKQKGNASHDWMPWISCRCTLWIMTFLSD